MQNKPNTYNDLIRGKNQLNYATRSGMAQTNAYLRNITTPSSQTTSSQVLPNQYKSESALNTPTENKKALLHSIIQTNKPKLTGPLFFPETHLLRVLHITMMTLGVLKKNPMFQNQVGAETV